MDTTTLTDDEWAQHIAYALNRRDPFRHVLDLRDFLRRNGLRLAQRRMLAVRDLHTLICENRRDADEMRKWW
ncbi:hypothetical protein ACFY2K_42835 [Kitasatospora sp. NPDC001309]|uniref:hypothetical protein n=1 Tax=Kitasatospora sp. NPDC001309 TaxID=3364013 RepID=UPI003698C5F6